MKDIDDLSPGDIVTINHTFDLRLHISDENMEMGPPSEKEAGSCLTFVREYNYHHDQETDYIVMYVFLSPDNEILECARQTATGNIRVIS